MSSHYLRNGAAASSHAASVSSPARVRAVHSSSNSEAFPKRSRSRAYGCDSSRKRSPVSPVPAQRSCNARNAALVELDRALPQSNLLKPLLMQHGETGKGHRRYQQQPKEFDVVKENHRSGDRYKGYRHLCVSEQPLSRLVGRLCSSQFLQPLGIQRRRLSLPRVVSFASITHSAASPQD